MRLLFTHEVRSTAANNHQYNSTGSIGYGNLLNYLYNFDKGTVILRLTGYQNRASSDWVQVDGARIDVQSIPDVRSFFQTARNFYAIYRAVGQAISRTDRAVVRLPGVCGLPVGFALLLRGRKFGVEFVGHPTESIQEVLKANNKKRPLLIFMVDFLNRVLLRHSVTVAYRSHYLRKAFPSRRPSTEFVFSGAQIQPAFITQARDAAFFRSRPFRIVSTGRMMPEKGHGVLLRAVARARELTKEPIELRIVGDGEALEELKEASRELGIDSNCEFTGRLPWGLELFSKMDDAHLYVLPSLTEGMPRSLIEAMARGMPALGSKCGGIPELLSDRDLFPAGDAEALAKKIVELVHDPERLARMSHRNFQASKEHWPESLDREKRKFWDVVMSCAH